MTDLSERELKALQIAAKAKLERSGDRWFVPAQTGQRGTYYTVKPDPAHPHCTCPDFESRKLRCKHIFAVEYTIEREQTSDGESVVTETLRISRKTYSQDWPSYNKAQTNEKEQFQKLLHALCQGIGEPSQNTGRPRVPLDDMIFSAAFKVYSTVSARRFMCDLHDSQTKGYISRVPAYNTIFKYFESELLTPHLQLLIEESALPLQAVESAFAVDSSGFSTSRFIQWVQAKHHNPKLLYDKLRKVVENLDPIKHPGFVFEPSNPNIAGRIIGIVLIAQPREPLATVERFYGSGVYALYYNGEFDTYRAISKKEHPIYVGKADPDDPASKTAKDQGSRCIHRSY